MSAIAGEVSPARIIFDHARLAQQLSVRVGSLEQAWWEHHQVGTAVDELASFLDSDLVPYVRAEEDVLYGASGGTGPVDGFLGSRRRISSQHRIREHDMVSEATSGLVHARTARDAVSVADQLQRVFETHIAHEDAKLASFAETAPGSRLTGHARPRHPVQPSAADFAGAGLGPFLENAVAEQHTRLARKIAWSPQAIRDDPAGQTTVYEQIIAALCRHAATMALHVYPAADNVLAPGDRDVTSALRTQLRVAERAMLSLERIIHGDRLEDPREFSRLWATVVRISQTHINLEEELIHRLAEHLPAEQTISLLNQMRSVNRNGPTRPHPSAPHSGRAARLAAATNARVDRIRDALDNRSV